ncbi:MAG: type II toxin-antitoxin system VapC family toxin [Planctomycetota bacterium]
MALQRVYLDTTVPSAYFDDRAPDRQRLTREFWHERMPGYNPVVSVLVIAEIRDTPNSDRRRGMELLTESLPVLPITPDAESLADEYVVRGAIRDKFRDDARHVAIAVTHRVGLLASWNFKHLVKLHVKRQINLINAILGYGVVEIVSPPEL